MCGDLWISEDGLRIFTKCGNVFRSSEIREQDMRYNGSLSKLNSVEHLSHSSSANKVIVIPESSSFGSGAQDTAIQIYNYDFLGFEKAIELPRFAANEDSASPH